MLKIYTNQVYADERGILGSFFKIDVDIFNRPFGSKYLEDRYSISRYGVIRGFHGDNKTDKLLICLYGQIRLISWDIINQKKEQLDITGPDKSVFIPKNHLLAHQCISKHCVIVYKWNAYYQGPENQYTVRYDDPTINATWVNIKPILSNRDKNAKLLQEISL